MYIDHDVLIGLIPCEHPFTFYPVVDISEPYLFVFLRMLQELSELPYTLEVLHVDIDQTYRIPTAQLYSNSPKNEIDPILDRYGALLRQVAGLSS
ncbi:hypothetical protein MAQ5080_01081 [Marinomonas aquimarina]|uniref:Uncharacterized protein n=1 Tax=Marinomonas aquimarina TaxID=295068 RepID=A0A1A8TA98_9GAMM|nr:hypothetical protein [Marinomonas aquimarina]SBS28395.1 hypothetical protein MAQ5080_01081 [Marinomonas aquimarina]